MEDGPPKEGILESHREMTQAAAHPLGHAFRLMVSQINGLGQKRRANIASGTPDRILAEKIKVIPWALTVCSPLAWNLLFRLAMHVGSSTFWRLP